LELGSLPEHNVVVQVAVEDGVLVNPGVEPLSCCRLVVANEAAFPPEAFLFQLPNQLHRKNVFVTFNPLSKVDKTFFPRKNGFSPKNGDDSKGGFTFAKASTVNVFRDIGWLFLI
jgi:hypothetical protein